VTGEGLAEALRDVDSLVDATSGASPEQQAATDFFTAATRNMQELGARAGVRRIVLVSIIGTDRFTVGYGAAKQAHERAMLAGPTPATIVRAAQFHEFVAQLMDWGRQDGAIYLPKMRTQLVAAHTVAETLADLATGCGPGPARGPNGVPILEIAGPREESLVEAARLLAAHRGEAVRIEAVSNPDDQTTPFMSRVRCHRDQTPSSPAPPSRNGSDGRPMRRPDALPGRKCSPERPHPRARQRQPLDQATTALARNLTSHHPRKMRI
jgi:uncharacterized protein YbjT (DUF2867 family)